jgi:prepilin-type N-terminal cleavage/methylation domain-containing protein
MNARTLLAHDRRGFSLVEIIIAILIATILVGLGMPRMFGFLDRSRVDNVRTQLAGDIAQARVLAVRSGQGATVTIGEAGYTVQALGGGGARQVDLSRDHKQLALSATAPLALPLVLTFDSRGLIRSVSAGGSAVSDFKETTLSIRNNAADARLRILQTGRTIHGN